MNRHSQYGPLVLTIAALSGFIAIVGYLITDAENNARRHALSEHDRAAIKQREDKADLERAELKAQNAALLKAFERIEGRLKKEEARP